MKDGGYFIKKWIDQQSKGASLYCVTQNVEEKTNRRNWRLYQTIYQNNNKSKSSEDIRRNLKKKICKKMNLGILPSYSKETLKEFP